MRAPKRHQLVEADLREAYNWYEDQQSELGAEFSEAFRRAHLKLSKNPLAYAVRFSAIRRLNLDRFPFGIFYIAVKNEIYILAVLHGSRHVKKILTGRQLGFFGESM